MKWWLKPFGRDNVGRQKGAKLLLADPETREEKAPDYVRWPEFDAVPTLCGIRMLEKVIHVALKQGKLLSHGSHRSGGNAVKFQQVAGQACSLPAAATPQLTLRIGSAAFFLVKEKLPRSTGGRAQCAHW